MYSMYAESRGWKIEVANSSETELGGIKEVSFVVEGQGAWSRLKYEAGGHRVQRVPVTESGGRIHTSAATVAVLPEIGELDFKLDPKDLQIDTYRSSGAGGSMSIKQRAPSASPICPRVRWWNVRMNAANIRTKTVP